MTRTSCTRTGSRRRSRRARPASRTSSRCGGPTSSSPGGRRGSSRPLVRGARLVIAASSFLADEARSLGAREVRVVPFGVAIPEAVAPPADPPHVLFAGRLSEEKGILEFVEATEGLPRVIVGDGPLRGRVPEARRLRPAVRARRVLRASRGRLRPVAARGVRRLGARGDGVRAARGRDRGSAGSPTSTATASCSSSPAIASHFDWASPNFSTTPAAVAELPSPLVVSPSDTSRLMSLPRLLIAAYASALGHLSSLELRLDGVLPL